MRAIRVAATASFAFALIAPVLAAQVPVRHAAANVGALEADLHYVAGADTWVTTNKPAYIALFDVSRTGLSMIYPTFSAQAEHPVFSTQRLVGFNTGYSIGNLFGGGTPLAYSMYSAYAGAGYSGYSGYSGGTRGLGGWPHMLLLVASTSPLRVTNPWSTNLALNHVLVQRQFLDLQADAGVAAILDLVKPLDPDAEMAFDYIDAIPARSAQYAAFDGPYDALYQERLRTCVSPLFALTSVAGNDLTPICMPLIYPKPATPATPPKDTGTTTTPAANLNRGVGEARLITDPNDIRRFIEENRRSDPNGVAKVQGAQINAQSGAQAARAPSGSAANVNRRVGDAAQFHVATKPGAADRPTLSGDRPAQQWTHFTAPTPVSQPAPSASHVSIAPAASPAAPIKP